VKDKFSDDISGATVGPIFNGHKLQRKFMLQLMTIEDGTHSTSRNVVGKLMLHTMQYPQNPSTVSEYPNSFFHSSIFESCLIIFSVLAYKRYYFHICSSLIIYSPVLWFRMVDISPSQTNFRGGKIGRLASTLS
jgi:hypothetical protein